MNEETRILMEEKLVKLLNLVEKCDDDQRVKVINDIRLLSTALNDSLSTDIEAFDRQEKRRIDEEKNASMAKIERAKAGFDIKKATFELVKVIIPTVISIAAYDIFQKRVLYFEENGRVSSTAGRELHLPKFFK